MGGRFRRCHGNGDCCLATCRRCYSKTALDSGRRRIAAGGRRCSLLVRVFPLRII
nr:MAG TPA: hypothetical protein [Caudoviricetes sp.]